MAKFIILFFLTTGLGILYLTYEGAGQEKIETVKKEASARSNSHRSGRSHSSSYNSSGYSYGK